MRSRRAPPCTNMAGSAMSVSPKRFAPRKSNSASPSITSWSAPSQALRKTACLWAFRNTAALVELGKEIVADDVVLIEDYAYPAYGVPSDETKEAIRLCARLEGMITDPVYEGKSMQGMIDLVKKGYFPKGSKVLYAHLGGAPAINGYAYTFRNG